MNPNNLDTSAFWDRCFSGIVYDYKALASGDWSNTLDRLRQAKVRTVLDLGCGYGHWSIVMARAGFAVTALDISQVALDILARWSAEEGLAVETVRCSAPGVGALGRSFDAVICNSVLDHMTKADAAKALAGIGKVLVPGGLAYVSFDGPEEGDPGEYFLQDDSTRRYVKGKYEGMLWRYYPDEEMKALLADFTINDFSTRKNGKRDIWMVNEKPR